MAMSKSRKAHTTPRSAELSIKIWIDKRSRKRLPDDTSDLAEWLAPHAEHVTSMLEQGYQSGEICDERFNGWWTINRD